MNKKISFRKTSFKSIFITFVAIAVCSVFIGAAQAEFYPDRQVYDYSKPCDASDSDPYDRCGSLEGPVFNSFINTPSYGDERSFLDARRLDQTSAGSYEDVLRDVTDGSKEVIIRTYVHNNANQATNESGAGIAKNSKVKIMLPTAEGNALRARGYISADNAEMVEDTVDLSAAEDFKVEYVTGSAKLYNNGPFKDGVTLSDDIVGSGALIGYDKLDGNIPGCFEYQTVVQITVKIIPKDDSDQQADFSKKVRIKGDTQWHAEVTTKPGDRLEWLLAPDFMNTITQDNITLRDVQVPNNQLVAGTVQWIDATSGTQTQSDAPLFDGGFNYGSYAAGSNFYVKYETTVLDNFSECEVRVRNLAYFKSTQQPNEKEAYADAVIKKPSCVTTTPTYTCESFTLSKNSVKINEKFTATVKVNAQNGAQFKLATFTFGDEATGQAKYVTNAISNGTVTAEHAYAKEGDYAPRVKLEFTVNGEAKTVEDAKCAAQIKVTKDAVLGTTTPPTTLPRTGASEVAGIFSVVTAAGAIAHRRHTLKKRS